MEDESALIAAAASENGGQLIVLSTRGHGRMAGALLGSVAQGLLHGAPCPILVIPPVDGKQATTETANEPTATTGAG